MRNRALLKEWWLRFAGNPVDVPFESRIFHSFSLIIMGALGFETIFNLIVGLYISTVITAVILVAQFLLFYLSRKKGKLNLAVMLSAIETHVLIGVGYFFSGGVQGSSLLMFAAVLFLIIAIVSQRKWIWWFSLNLILVAGLCVYEYYHPGIVKQQNYTRLELFVDNSASYIIVVTLLTFCIIQIRRGYSEQKSLTEKQTLELQRLNAEKDKLFSILSHDLSTPLNSVKQYLHLLTEVDLDAAERLDMEKGLLVTTEHTQELLNNLLNWSRNQLQAVKANLREINLQQQLHKTIGIAGVTAVNKGIALHTAIDANIMVTADIDMIQLVVRNLLNNAIKFTPADGRVALTAAVQNGWCTLSVTDNGIGIPTDKQAAIFSLVAAATYGTEKEKGTGLGLMLCKDYMQLQGGSIWFSSTEGAGASFHIALKGRVV
ncbi:sensor histidine kinase [Deminuibacter soli]|uniref:histidine kinase n=1 Tax=Deminuibacter soli TaxID=2291815 RepID=A0A3E1NLR2_9BACT|nr:HAMP domain-containing sensor histidine kinase [Deminuibacter soli]RFM28857.1 sensor histidine kinase [Deminuibacter soli]